MQDKFEEFIDRHRTEFDIHEPPMRLWNAINKQLPVQKKRKPIGTYLLAASILLLIGIAVGYFQLQQGQQKQSPPNAVVITLKPEINEAEHYYTSLVEANLNQLDKYSSDYPDLCKNFKTEIDTLNTMYAQLKVEYNNSMGNEAVLQAMVENLQKQVSLIQMQIQIIRNLKHKKENPESKKIKFT